MLLYDVNRKRSAFLFYDMLCLYWHSWLLNEKIARRRKGKKKKKYITVRQKKRASI
jgi:hypothetical protein